MAVIPSGASQEWPEIYPWTVLCVRTFKLEGRKQFVASELAN